MEGYYLDNTTLWLKQLTEAAGVSGFESRIKNLLLERLSGITEVTKDKLGSIIFKKRGSSDMPRIMLASHMDEIGFMVKHITKEGYLKFTTIGGWCEYVMPGQRVTVMASKGDVVGVISSKPPHVLTPEEQKEIVKKKDMYIDVGASDENEARQIFGIRPGDPIVPKSNFAVMGNEKYLMAKAWDDRIGCAVMDEVIRRLTLDNHPNTVFGVGTVQEEIGSRGAVTSANVIDPHLAFTVDVCVSGDTLGVTADYAVSHLGQGVVISIYDPSLIPYPKLRDFAIDIAEYEGIPYQLEFSERGGTDAGRIHMHGQGVPSLVISIPTRYIHSHNSIIHRDDYESAIRLLISIIKKLDYDKYEELIG